nr:MAG TPA: hypothetical protein [Caudoviricetes sp.]DAX89424.1 MAG TPA: hypothetical protein [Caudoviricetes sp.]
MNFTTYQPCTNHRADIIMLQNFFKVFIKLWNLSTLLRELYIKNKL